MKISTFVVAALCGSVGATFMGNDLLAAEALAKLTLDVAQNGYPDAEKCTLKNVAVRQEWYVNNYDCNNLAYAVLGHLCRRVRSSTISMPSNA
jgi:hypothetical protein